MNLTKTTVEAMVYTKSGNAADYRWDGRVKGFGVRVYPSGRKTYIVSYRNPAGSKRFFKLGSHGALTVQQARDLAQKKLSEVASGGDPQDDRQKLRGQLSFHELADRYLDYVKAYKVSAKDDAQRLRDHLLPELGRRKLSEIALQQIEKLHRNICDRTSPATANRCLALLKHLFSTAVRWGYLDASPAQHAKPFREPPPRDIVLSPEEFARIIESCDADENPFAGALFKMAILTGRRLGELMRAKWEYLLIERCILTLPETKAGERQHAYLCDDAIKVLQSMPRLDDNPYIFAGSKSGRPLVHYRRAWERIVRRAGLEMFPPHGLRHAYASAMVADGRPLDTVGALVGHKSLLTTRKYAHHRPDALLKAANTIGRLVGNQVPQD